MKWAMLIFLGIFLASFVSASTTEVFVTVGGCVIVDGSDVDNLAFGECSASGELFCDSVEGGLDTREEGLGCARGDPFYSQAGNDPFCCPDDSSCEEVSAGVFKCERRTENCRDQNNSADCNDIGCIWLEEEGACVIGTNDFACSYYKSESTCDADLLGLGLNGVGAEKCGETITCNGEDFLVKDCECEWDGGECKNRLVGSQVNYAYAGTPDEFWCMNDYDLGNCTDGRQDVIWGSNKGAIGSSFPAGIPADCLIEIGCNDGSEERFCGEPVIKLPTFSLFALFASITIIGSYYFRREQKGLNKETH